MTEKPKPAGPSGRSRRTRSNDWIELLAVAVGVALIVATATRSHFEARYLYFAEDGVAELQPLRMQYGPGHYSRNVEEWCIRDFFKDQRNGVFVDVGANHYLQDSNTYFLETRLGWSGLALDAQAQFGPDYRVHRPRTKFAAVFVSDVADTTTPFFVPDDNSLVASSNQDFTIREGHPGRRHDVPTTTLDVALNRAGIASVDFLSMDIELAEPKALRGFDIERFKPKLVCIESHAEVRQEILDYFAGHRYVVVAKYLRADPKNLYFAHPTM